MKSYTEKLSGLYERVCTALNNQYNRDYLAISEAVKTVGQTWSEENNLMAMNAAITNIGPENLTQKLVADYNEQKEEFATSIIAAKKAMLDINIYSSKYHTDLVFKVNERSTSAEVLNEVNNVLDELSQNRDIAQKIALESDLEVNTEMIEAENDITYSTDEFNITWEDIVIAKYEKEEVKDEMLQDIEYDPETNEARETLKDPDDLEL